MDGIAIKGGSGGPDAELPRRVAPAESGIREVHSTVEVGRQSDENNETGQMETTGKELDEKEDGAEPVELGGNVEKRAAAINTSETRVAIDEQIQSGV